MNKHGPVALDTRDIIVSDLHNRSRDSLVPWVPDKPNPSHANGYMFLVAVNHSYDLRWDLRPYEYVARCI